MEHRNIELLQKALKIKWILIGMLIGIAVSIAAVCISAFIVLEVLPRN